MPAGDARTPQAGVAGDGAWRLLGAVAVVRLTERTETLRSGPALDRLDSLVLWLQAGRADGDPGPAGGGVLLDLAVGGHLPGDGLAVVVPRRLLPTLFADRAAARPVSPSVAVAAVRQLATDLLPEKVALDATQNRLAGRALGELVAAALLPLAATGTRVAPRRTASLLDRLIAYVDDHLGDTLDAPALCAALACSRSALYRAAGPAGGVAALVAGQRLAAVHHRLAAADERRPVAALARTHGFATPAAFSRSFRRRYGVTARAVRRQKSLEA